MKSKRVAYKVYQVAVNGTLYEVVGQNQAGTSNEWQLFQVNGYGRDWCFTFDTKREAIEYLTTIREG